MIGYKHQNADLGTYLNLVKDNEDFVVKKDEHIIIIDYVVDNFKNPMEKGISEEEHTKRVLLLNCRGITFNSNTGQCIRLPLNKFYNCNQTEGVMLKDIDITQPHDVLVKCDGSMVATYLHNDKVIYGSRMGATFIHEQVSKFIEQNKHYETFVLDMMENGFTPIFEWTSRQQRIVLDYPQDNLILLAIRNIENGWYAPYEDIKHLANKYNIPVVEKINGKFGEEFLEKVKNETGVEGYVIRFNDQHCVKVKSEWYCNLHKIKSVIEYERGVVGLILIDKTDDIKPFLIDTDLERLKIYESAFKEEIKKYAHQTLEVKQKITDQNISRKDFALGLSKTLDHVQTSIIFHTWDINDVDLVRKELYSLIEKKLTKEKYFTELRESSSLFKNIPEWRTVNG